jgi:hypothetical protein
MRLMSKFKPYLEYLENADKIKELAHEIVDLELDLDKLEEQKRKKDAIIPGLKFELAELEKQFKEENDPDNLKNLTAILKGKKHEITIEMSKAQPLNDKIAKTELELFRLQEARKEAIRRGMADLFHQAKEDYEEARLEWIKYSEMSLKAHEKVNKRKNEMDAIKNAFKAEFGNDK